MPTVKRARAARAHVVAASFGCTVCHSLSCAPHVAGKSGKQGPFLRIKQLAKAKAKQARSSARAPRFDVPAGVQV